VVLRHRRKAGCASDSLIKPQEVGIVCLLTLNKERDDETEW
jgi:hypothetical protein